MLVPNYWAEAKLKEKIGKRSVTIKRFGWSDISEADALENAQERVREAMERAKNGEQVRRLDHKRSYNGAEGLPIREEVVLKQENIVVTRNSYGALCLNTPDVLFVDIDFEMVPSRKLYFSCVLVLFVIGVFSALYFKSLFIFFMTLILSFVFGGTLAAILIKLKILSQGGYEKMSMRKIENLVATNPEMNLRVYRTPMGLRVLALHKLYDPQSEEVAKIFKVLSADSLYSTMCRNQNCFRARISPKPWRMGMTRIGPRPGVWPVKEERIPERRAWIEEYNSISDNYSSCHFKIHLGSEISDPIACEVLELHDQYCNAEKQLKLA